MKRLLLLLLIILCVVLGYSFAKREFDKKQALSAPKTPILKFALVADSHTKNDLLSKALAQAKEGGSQFVIGLGDWTNVGTVGELTAAKKVFDGFGLPYYVTAGDHDLWDSRDKGNAPLANFNQVFGDPNHNFSKNSVNFVIVDNSDIYRGITDAEISNFKSQISNKDKLTFVFAHKAPWHPQSAHIMGEDSAQVARQAKQLMNLLEEKKVDGFFCGDLHFFAQFNSPANVVKMTTIGAVTDEPNFQGPRFAQVTVYSDYSWEAEDIAVR